jgi:membrane protein implicated in regulation of membrane protease activity
MDGGTPPEVDERRSSSRTMRRRLIAGLTVVGLLSTVAFVVLVALGTEPDTLLFEGGKTLLQLALVTVIGAALSLLASEYQQRRTEEEQERDEERRQEEYRQELRKTTLARATASYMQVKRVRRLMRVALTDQRRAIPAGDYDKQMTAIVEAQLQFETLREEVETGAAVFRSHDVLAEKLKAIDDHLSALITEWELQRPNWSGRHPQVRLDRVQKLDDFLAQYSENPEKFRQGFKPLKSSFDRVQELIRHDLLPTGRGAR